MKLPLVYNVLVCWLILIIAMLCQQMFMKAVSRLFHTYKASYAAEKSHLALLRKKTGYTFANCKKALELHNNDAIKVTLKTH